MGSPKALMIRSINRIIRKIGEILRWVFEKIRRMKTRKDVYIIPETVFRAWQMTGKNLEMLFEAYDNNTLSVDDIYYFEDTNLFTEKITEANDDPTYKITAKEIWKTLDQVRKYYKKASDDFIISHGIHVNNDEPMNEVTSKYNAFWYVFMQCAKEIELFITVLEKDGTKATESFLDYCYDNIEVSEVFKNYDVGWN